MIDIKMIHARQILDSRGNPTVECEVMLKSGQVGTGISPSGASTGKLEAIELRDNDENKFNGKSVYTAVNNINTTIKKNITGRSFTNQEEFDDTLIELDGTKNKKNLGANAILATSIAFCKARSILEGVELFQLFGDSCSLPVPLMNILNGGAHANNKLDFQEFMIIPVNFPSFSSSLQAGCEVFHSLKNQLSKQSLSTAVGDEGGFAPNFESNQFVIEEIIKAIEGIGLKYADDIFLGLDCAASELYVKDTYQLKSEGNEFDSDEMIEYLISLINKYQIFSIEDPLDESDWGGWKKFTTKVNDLQIVGDDIFVTKKEFLERGIVEKVANSILIKPNQVGTLTETLQTVHLAKSNDYGTIISHRSGETEDTFIADLAVGVDAKQIKTGAPARSDRTAKYNRLLMIENELYP